MGGRIFKASRIHEKGSYDFLENKLLLKNNFDERSEE